MRKYIYLVLILCVAQKIYASTFYVLDGGESTNCTSWSDACDQVSTAIALADRDDGNDIIYVADGSYLGSVWNKAAVGTNKIIVKHANSSDHGTGTGWNAAYGDGQAIFTTQTTIRAGYYEIDGNSATSYGFKIEISGDPNPGGVYSGIYIDWTTGIESFTGHVVRSVEIDLEELDHCVDSDTEQVGIYNNGSPNAIFEHLSIKNYGDAIINDSTAESPTISKVYFERTALPTVSCDDHGDAIVFAGISGATIRYCDFNWVGQQIWIADTYTADGFDIYGNIFRGSKEGSQAVCTGGSTVTNFNFINNTAYGVGTTIENSLVVSSGKISNNIFYDYTNAPAFGSATHDYNYCGMGTDCAEETNGTNNDADPFVSKVGGNFNLSAPISGDNTVGETYQTDIVGVTRGADGVWDIGAYEYRLQHGGGSAGGAFNF